MAALADRVKESTATTGQGTVTLAGAAVGFRSFTAAFGNGVAVYYVIAGGAEWEVGIGTTGAGTLSRDTVIGSSAGGTTKVTFSAGTKDVFCSVPASRLVLTDNLASANTANAVVQRDGSGNFAAGTITATLTGNASTATALSSARTFAVTGDITGTVSSDLTSGASIATAIAAGVIVDADINASAGIVDTKLATISTAGKVSNSATTATSANTASAIVARDGSGNFAADTITAALTGNASTATALQTARNINGVSFNGTADITVTAAAGTLTGTTLASNVVSSSLTSVGTLANLTVTNPITGSVSGSSGSTTGNAATATALQTARNINGVSFNGTADITVTAAAGTLSGNTLASGVTASSLTSVGTLTSLAVSGDLTVDTSTFKVDSTNNRVGIGTATPSYRADIDNGGASAAALRVVGNDQSNVRLRFENSGSGGRAFELTGGLTGANNSAFTLYDATAAATRLSVDASGNLGLGVTPSAWGSGTKAFDIGSGSALYNPGSTTQTWLLTNAYYDNSNHLYKGTGPAAWYQQVGAAHVWYGAPSGTAGNAITFTQAMTLDASGNLGVGTTSLNLNGNNQAITVRSAQSGSTSAGVDIGGFRTNDGTVAQLTFFNGSNLLGLVNVTRRAADNSGDLEFYTANAGSVGLRARITAAGSFVAGASAALATTATDGFLYVPTCAGTPTGTPTAITGMAPIVVDTTNSKLYFYSNAAWRDAGP